MNKLVKPKVPKKPSKKQLPPSEIEQKTIYIFDSFVNDNDDPIVIAKDDLFNFAKNKFPESFEQEDTVIFSSNEQEVCSCQIDIGIRTLENEGYLRSREIKSERIRQLIKIIEEYPNIINYEFAMGQNYIYVIANIKKSIKQFKEEQDQYKNRFKIWEEQYKQYLNDLKEYEKNKKELRRERIKKELEKLEMGK